MKPTIEKPHIFISYAWSSQEYKNKVLEFASSLRRDGIDVELDQWSLKPGNDTYAYMEQMVNNPEITNVLILLNPVYYDKANNREGGVGTETQIISPDVYSKAKQEKFIPVVFERGENGEICKPTFLNVLLHFDLSKDELYAEEYRRLVKWLYGIEVISKPEIGKRPIWVEEESISNFKLDFPNIAKAKSDKEKNFYIQQALSDIENSFIKERHLDPITTENYVAEYCYFQKYRNMILTLVKDTIWIENIERIIGDFFESTANRLGGEDNLREIKATMLHETFIYVISMFFKSSNYRAIGNILKRTYFKNESGNNATDYSLFYTHNSELDKVMHDRDKKDYYSGTAQLWIETINPNFVSKNDFVKADLLLYNFSIYSKSYFFRRKWFPVSYIYIDEWHSPIKDIGQRLVSKEYVESIMIMFGFDKISDFVASIKESKDRFDTNKTGKYRYINAWNEASLLHDFVNPDDIGKYN